MQADYISSNQFKVSTDKTEEFLAGRRVRANCDGTYIYSTIQSSTYSDPDTTVTLEEDELISSLSEVHYGIVSIGEQGSFPNHSHDGTEGTGGGLSLLTLSDTPSVYDEGKYLRSTTSGVELEDLNDYYYTESEVDTISGTLQTDINTKPDTEWFLTNGTPSNSIGKLNDVAIDQNVGDIYKMVAGTEEASETFYPVVGGDDGWRGSVSGYYSTDTRLYIGGWNEDFGSWIRFPNINILQGTVIVGAYIKFTARASNAEVTCNLNCYFNNVDNAVAPGNATAFDALALTDAVAWNGISAWTDGVQYDTPNLVSIIQNIVDRPGFSSGNAVQFVVKNNSSSNIAYRRPSSIEYESGTEKAELHITWLETVGVGAWEEKLTPDFLKLSDTPTTYSGVSGKYLKTTTSGIEFSDEDLYTKVEVDTISGSLYTQIPDTEWYLTESVPSNSIGKENDVAVNQDVGTVYKKSELFSDSAIYYPEVSGDDGMFRVGGFYTGYDYIRLGYYGGQYNIFIRFPNIIIPKDSNITNAFVRFTSYGDQTGTVCNTNIYFNNVDDAVAPTYESQALGLDLTDAVAWDNLPAWLSGNTYDTLNISNILQEIVNRDGWSSGNAVQVVVKDDGSTSSPWVSRSPYAVDYLSGAEKAELHIEWSILPVWEEKLTPDFLKLSDTPTTYSEADGKYLKTTTSGIGFVEDLYTKSEVDTISGSLQTDMEAKTVWHLTEGSPSGSVGKEHDVAMNYNDGAMYKRLFGEGGGTVTAYPVVGGDDGNWASGIFNNSNNSLFLGLSDSVDYNTFIRVPNINIVKSATITNAFIRFTAYSSSSSTYVHNVNDLTPEMTSNTAPSPNVASSSTQLGGSYAAWYAFDHDASSRWIASIATGWLKFDFGAGNTKVANTYTLSATPSLGANAPNCPKTWTLQGSNNDSDWTTLDTKTNVPGWTDSEMRTYTFVNEIEYRYYKLDITATQGGAYVTVAELELFNNVVDVRISLNDVDNAVAPINETTADALVLTTNYSDWVDTSEWADGYTYDSVDFKGSVQEVIDRDGWSSGNSVTVIIKSNVGDSAYNKIVSSVNYLSGTEKPELHIAWEVSNVWEEKLSPDFLKLSDTPTTYSGVYGQYLKTTTSGIDFVDDLYTKSEVDIISGTLQTSIDSMPVTLLELADTPTTYSGSVGEYLKTTSSGVIFSDIDSEYWESVDVFLDENYSNDKGLPTQVERGLFKGYSMPIWATPANQYEELVFRIRVPFRWDGVTNPTFMILVSTSATEDVGDKFKFQMEWESKGVSNVIPDTTAETLTDEVPVTDGTAYYSYLASASLDATKLISGDNLQFRVRRVTATDPQVSNEIIIWHWDSRWKMNKLGTVSE